MLDGFILQIVVFAVVLVAAILAAVWFVGGITKKGAAWIVGCAVPCAVVVAVAIALLSA